MQRAGLPASPQGGENPRRCSAGPQERPRRVRAVGKGHGEGWHPRQGRPLPQTLPSLAPPSRVTVRCQPPRVVSLNGHFWTWPGRSRSPEPLGSHWPFPELQGRPQGLSYSPGFHRSPCNKGLRPRQCINKGALSGKQGSEALAVGENKSGRGRGGCSCMCGLLSSRRAVRVPAPRGERTEDRHHTMPSQLHSHSCQKPGSTRGAITLPDQRPRVKPRPCPSSRADFPSICPLLVSQVVPMPFNMLANKGLI